MRSYKKSFTLLETLVAIYVLLVGIVGVMDITSQNLASGTISKNQLIAANLAQEGIELVRNKRDSNFLERYNSGLCPWPCDQNENDMGGMLDASNNPCGGVGCRLDSSYTPTSDAVVFTTCGGTCPNLRQNLDGTFDYSSIVESIFRRTIIITAVTHPPYPGGMPVTPASRTDWEVRSIVSWPGRFAENSLEERVILTPWLK